MRIHIFTHHASRHQKMKLSAKKLLKPERLCPDDTIGIIAPASAPPGPNPGDRAGAAPGKIGVQPRRWEQVRAPPDPNAVDRAAAALEKFGFKPKLGKHVRARLGFLAGTDHERATDLMAMFADKKVKAIICLRGGYGSSRIRSEE